MAPNYHYGRKIGIHPGRNERRHQQKISSNWHLEPREDAYSLRLWLPHHFRSLVQLSPFQNDFVFSWALETKMHSLRKSMGFSFCSWMVASRREKLGFHQCLFTILLHQGESSFMQGHSVWKVPKMSRLMFIQLLKSSLRSQCCKNEIFGCEFQTLDLICIHRSSG